jgi:lipopolysaccharide transport system permease protein
MIENFKLVINYRELLINLVIREIKIRYKQSILGIAWAVFQPLLMMVIFTIVFSYFARMPSDGIPYPLFSYSALLPWIFFSSAINKSTHSLVNNRNLITKVYFPREILPITSIITALIDFGVASIVFIGLLIFYQVDVSWYILLLLPIIIIQVFLVLGLSLFFSSLNVFFRDIGQVVPLLIQVWMYLSPIVYPISLVPEKVRYLYILNPMVGIIDSYRKVIIQGTAPDFTYLSVSLIVTFIICFFSNKFFRRLEMSFADII